MDNDSTIPSQLSPMSTIPSVLGPERGSRTAEPASQGGAAAWLKWVVLGAAALLVLHYLL